MEDALAAQSKTGRIGIIAGSGPEAGIDLWAKVLDENRRSLGAKFRGDIDAPEVTVLSVPELGLSMDLPDTTETVWMHLGEACRRIGAQVDVFAIACNTLYAFEDEILALGLPAKLVSPVDSVRAEANRRGIQTIALLAAGPVADFDGGNSPYERLAGELEIELPPEPQRLHQLIEDIKRTGGASPQLETEFGSIVSQLSSDVAALACTELPLLSADHVGIDLIDVTHLLARDLLGIRS